MCSTSILSPLERRRANRQLGRAGPSPDHATARRCWLERRGQPHSLGSSRGYDRRDRAAYGQGFSRLRRPATRPGSEPAAIPLLKPKTAPCFIRQRPVDHDRPPHCRAAASSIAHCPGAQRPGRGARRAPPVRAVSPHHARDPRRPHRHRRSGARMRTRSRCFAPCETTGAKHAMLVRASASVKYHAFLRPCASTTLRKIAIDYTAVPPS